MILQNSQYLIRALTIFSGGANPNQLTNENNNNVKEFAIDIRGLFQELNIYDNLFFPCVTGTILIHDGIGLNRKIRFDGSEYIFIYISKDKDETGIDFEIKKTFLIHKVTDRTSIGMNSEAYTLHFISQEFLLSEQQKIRRSFEGLYSDTVRSILKNYLNVDPNVVVNNRISGVVENTKNGNKIIIPNLTPFKAIEFITSRSLNQHGVPDFVFWQDHYFGYNFTSLSTIFSRDADFEINFGVKNMTLNYATDDNSYYYMSMLGANDYKIVTNFDLFKNIKNGYYAGKFFGFDPLTRKFAITEVSHDSVFKKVPPGKKMPFTETSGSNSGSHANPYPFNTKVFNKKNKPADQMFESKITVYPFEIERKNSSYVKEKERLSLNDIDETHDYILQRKSIFHNLMQKCLRITMPGNFRFLSGKNVILNVPHFYNERDVDGEDGDMSLSGKYIITAVRHIIRQDKHETMLEVATDSSQIDPITGRQ